MTVKMIFQFTCIINTIVLLLFTSSVNSEESIDNNTQICMELCDNCNGIGTYVNGGCQCYIESENRETAECIDTIKKEATDKNLTLLNIINRYQSKILNRSTRCCPNSNRLRLSDIIRVAKYFMNDGPRTGTRILGNRKNFYDSIIDTGDCQYCPDDDDDDDDANINVMSGEESIDSYLTTPSPIVPYVIEPHQTPYSAQNSYPYNNYNEPNIVSFNHVQLPNNCYRSLIAPSAPTIHDYSRGDQLSPLLPSPYPLTQVTPLIPQVQLSHHHQHHAHHEFIEPPFTNLPVSNYRQYSLDRVPYRNNVKSDMSGICRNSIASSSYLYPSSILQPSNIGIKTRQRYRPRTSVWPSPIVQPLHTLPQSMIPPIGRQSSQLNNLGWSSVLPMTNIQNGMNQQFMPYTGYSMLPGFNYPVEPLLGAANPNADENKKNNDGSILNSGVQSKITENHNESQSPIGSIRSDIAVQPVEQSTLSPQNQMTPTLDNTLLINIPNTMKRTLPAPLRYRQMNKRELKMKAF